MFTMIRFWEPLTNFNSLWNSKSEERIPSINRTLQLDGTSDVGQSFLRRWSPSPPLTSWVRCTCGLLLEIGGGNVVWPELVSDGMLEKGPQVIGGKPYCLRTLLAETKRSIETASTHFTTRPHALNTPHPLNQSAEQCDAGYGFRIYRCRPWES